jgi:hypothetical protein
MTVTRIVKCSGKPAGFGLHCLRWQEYPARGGIHEVIVPAVAELPHHNKTSSRFRATCQPWPNMGGIFRITGHFHDVFALLDR